MKKVPFELRETIHSPTNIKAVLQSAVNEANIIGNSKGERFYNCLLYTSPSPRDGLLSRMPSSA